MFSWKVLLGRIIFSIASVASLIAIIWGLKSVIAHGGVKGASPPAMYAAVFGFCALIISVIMLVLFWLQDVSYERITKSDHPVLARWQCSSKEAKQFIAAEAAQQGLSAPPSLRYLVIILIVIALGIGFIQRANFEWGGFFGANAMLGGFVTVIFFLMRANNAANMQATIDRANQEVIIDEKGILAGGTVLNWRDFNWGLKEATYENGQPDVLKLVFLSGTLPGSGTMGVLRQVAYVAGAVSSPGVPLQKDEIVRVPVTASKADEVRQLVSSFLAKHLISPPVIP